VGWERKAVVNSFVRLDIRKKETHSQILKKVAEGESDVNVNDSRVGSIGRGARISLRPKGIKGGGEREPKTVKGLRVTTGSVCPLRDIRGGTS